MEATACMLHVYRPDLLVWQFNLLSWITGLLAMQYICLQHLVAGHDVDMK